MHAEVDDTNQLKKRTNSADKDIILYNIIFEWKILLLEFKLVVQLRTEFKNADNNE